MCLPAFSHNLHAQPSSEHHLPIKTPVQPRAFCEIFSPSGACGTQPVHRQLLATCRTVAQVKIDERLVRSEEHTSELQSRLHLVCRLLLEKKKNNTTAS